MHRTAWIVLFAALPFWGWAGSSKDPGGSQSLPGWTQTGREIRFAGRALFNHIDGGAEIFLEFGFQELLIRKYQKDRDELSLELYEMKSPESALGLYLMKAGRETPIPGIESRNTGETAQFTVLKGRYLIQINNFSLNASCVPAMADLASNTLAVLPFEGSVDFTAVLPQEGLVAGSAVLFRGPIGLQSLYYFGQGDILLQKGSVFGAGGAYSGPEGSRYLVLVVDYPKEKEALEAFNNLRMNLDATLRILAEGPAGFTFEDFQKKFGEVRLDGRRLVLRANLLKTSS